MSNLILPPLIIGTDVPRGIARQRKMLFEMCGDGGGELGVRERSVREGFDMG
jgi:hypothetical protein